MLLPISRQRVLIADDAPDIARRLSQLIQAVEGVEVIGPAADGAEALCLFDQTAPDGVLLDVRMPLLSGIDVVQAIRARGAGCWAILVTSYVEPSFREVARLAGADHVVQKTEIQRVVELVRGYAQRAREHQRPALPFS